MTWLLVALRSFWVGGLTFYGIGVIPTHPDELDRPEAGRITQRVTDWLNEGFVRGTPSNWSPARSSGSSTWDSPPSR